MRALNVGPYTLRINNRKLLSALYAELGLAGATSKAAITAVDKLLKIGPDGVAAELRKIEGISERAVEIILRSTTIQCGPSELREKIAGLNLSSPLIEEGITELLTICELLPPEVTERLTIDMSLARGLDYYTGVIVEVGLDKYPEFGTVVSGGRYDNLASEFTDQKFPGVGVSIGLSRLMELLFSEGLIETKKVSPSVALVTVYDESDRVFCNTVAHQLRTAGVPTEVYFKAPKLGKQIEYAESKGMRYVFFIDSGTRQIKVKDLLSKEQREIASINEWLSSR
jgi:histidyl-tRNA synthetase